MILTEKEKEAIADLDIIRAFEKGTVLVREGDVIEGGHFVIKGCLRSYCIIDGEERTTEFYTENESVPVISGDDGSRAAHYVSCVEDSVITVNTPDMKKEMFEEFPRFKELCLIVSEQLLDKQVSSFYDFKNSSPEQRYLHLLENRSDLLQRVPQYQIASYLGIKPQSLSRIRKRLAEKDSCL